MKLLIPLAVLALCVYYYWETHREQAAAPVAVAAPTPARKQKYYHSPLDAPAMRTGTHSGTGYSSSNRNTNWKGSHLSDGQAQRTSVPDAPTDQDDN